MQPFAPSTHPNAADCEGADESAPVGDASLALRVAQRMFAPLLETGVRHTTFRFAQLRSGARRALSALSADDRVRLARWLALLCAHGGDRAHEFVDSRLLRVDALLAAAVLARLATWSDGQAARGVVAA